MQATLFEDQLDRELTWLVELEGLVSSIDGDRHGADTGHGLHQGMFLSTGNVYEAGVVDGVVLGVVVTWLVILEQRQFVER